jgi:hypothetical protein
LSSEQFSKWTEKIDFLLRQIGIQNEHFYSAVKGLTNTNVIITIITDIVVVVVVMVVVQLSVQGYSNLAMMMMMM